MSYSYTGILMGKQPAQLKFYWPSSWPSRDGRQWVQETSLNEEHRFDGGQ